jgi:hypothetical protein
MTEGLRRAGKRLPRKHVLCPRPLVRVRPSQPAELSRNLGICLCLAIDRQLSAM